MKKQNAPKAPKKDQPQKKQNDKPAAPAKNADKQVSPAKAADKPAAPVQKQNNNPKPESNKDQKKNDKKQKKNKQPAIARPKQETQILSKKLEKNEEVTEDNSKVSGVPISFLKDSDISAFVIFTKPILRLSAV